jgi:glycosyltransferase involved in cell wall biosynthesis
VCQVTLESAEIVQTRPQTSSERRPFRVSVVIPTLNEARNIAWVLENMPLDVDEVVIVDGRSTDRTIEVALAIRPDTVVVTDDAPGKGCAIRKGIETATGDFVVMLDADGSMDPREISRFVQPLCDGHDLVRGSRFMAGGGTTDISPVRNAGNRGLLLLTRALYGVARSDLCYGYAAFRRSRIMALGLTATGFEIEAQLFLRADRAGLAVAEVPSFEAPRRTGTSNLHAFRDGRRVLKTIISERLRATEYLGGDVAISAGAGMASFTGSRRRQSVALAFQQQLRSRTAGLVLGRRTRIDARRAPDEQAMTAALVWSLAVKHGDNRLRAVALADYREARRHAAAALPIPGSSRLLEIRQELTALRA